MRRSSGTSWMTCSSVERASPVTTAGRGRTERQSPMARRDRSNLARSSGHWHASSQRTEVSSSRSGGSRSIPLRQAIWAVVVGMGRPEISVRMVISLSVSPSTRPSERSIRYRSTRRLSPAEQPTSIRATGVPCEASASPALRTALRPISFVWVDRPDMRSRTRLRWSWAQRVTVLAASGFGGGAFAGGLAAVSGFWEHAA